MKRMVMLLGLTGQIFNVTAQKDFSQYPEYKGNDLGLSYSPTQSSFRIWSPFAQNAQVQFYKAGSGGQNLHTIPMERSRNGTWTAIYKGDHLGKYYTFRVQIDGKWSEEVTDPYTKATGVNGRRAMIIDLKKTNPPGWENDKSPAFTGPTSAIIYELHVRDASIATNSGIKQKGKFLGLTERGTKNPEGLSTGLDHMRELGVSHVHLLPFYDINSVDESKPHIAQYNWGYDPLNYNVPEGSYATDAANGNTRIMEFKKLVKTFHDNGLRVVMDVVYNHTAKTANSNFNQLVPGYYYRQNAQGGFSNATACGNETASERPMMRKFILESMKYWVEEYHIDGFRVDLMGVHDIETMNIISRELHKIRPDILLYGEGWTAGESPLPDSLRALKKYAYRLDRIAVFSDDMRDGIKGSVFVHPEKGFVSGGAGLEESIKFGITAACQHPQVQYTKVNYSKSPYANQPHHTVNYADCHDNHTLWDKLSLSAPEVTEKERQEMHKLALSIVLTSQGISFLHAGSEFLRSKKGVENSFESPDSINEIDWHLKSKNKDVHDYIKGLISMRKKHPAFTMRTTADLGTNIRFMENTLPGIVAYTINGEAVKDSWKKIFIIYNGNKETKQVSMPAGAWKSAVRNNLFIAESGISNVANVLPFSCSIFYQ